MTQQGAEQRHRDDIQALRALAVTVVIIDHYAPGGFTGVDMFFVISGYLIVGQLLARSKRGERGQLARFYARRVRRILPAAVVCATVTFVAFASFLNPLRVDQYGRQFNAAIAFVSNFAVRTQPGGYFAPIDPSPFQHFWSLAVEEQFYLLAPLLLIGAAAVVRRQRALVGLIGLATLVSFAGAALLTSHVSSWTFFMLPSRAWEFGVGALVSVAPAIVRGARALRWTGVMVAVVPMFLLDSTSGVPGLAALPVVLGTASVLAAGRHGALGPHAFLLRSVRFVGDLSYSLYLWHWPPICFVLIEADGGLPSPRASVVALSIGLVLAVASYYLVERPIHRSDLCLVRPLVTLGGTFGLAAVLLAVGIVISRPDAAGNQGARCRPPQSDGDVRTRQGPRVRAGERQPRPQTRPRSQPALPGMSQRCWRLAP